MSQLHNLIINSAFLLTLPFAAFSEDRDIGKGPLEFTNMNYPSDAKAAELEKLPLTDPDLRWAYYWLIKGSTGGPKITDDRTPELLEILKDVKRRGDSATPLWLDIMAKNPESDLEWHIPHVIERIGTIKMEPYIDYLRKMIQTRPEEVNGTACGVSYNLFRKYGTKEDVQMVHDLAKKRPFLAPFVETEVRKEAMYEQLDAEKAMQEKATGITQVANPQAPKRGNPTVSTPFIATEEKKPASQSRWLPIATVVSFLTLGVVWYLLKRRK